MIVKPPTRPKYIKIIKIYRDGIDNCGVIPKEEPTVPIAEAVSYQVEESGKLSIVDIAIAPNKLNTTYIIAIVAAFFIISISMCQVNDTY